MVMADVAAMPKEQSIALVIKQLETPGAEAMPAGALTPARGDGLGFGFGSGRRSPAPA